MRQVKKGPHPDAALDRQLRDALAARVSRASTEQSDVGCLDDQTLAAWADDELNPSERAAAEAHAADCARCQSLLAAMVRTAQPAADAKSPWWRAPALKWVAPLAAAAALLVWGVQSGRQSTKSLEQVAPVASTATVARPDSNSTLQLAERGSPRGAEQPSAARTLSAAPREKKNAAAAMAPAPAAAAKSAEQRATDAVAGAPPAVAPPQAATSSAAPLPAAAPTPPVVAPPPAGNLTASPEAAKADAGRRLSAQKPAAESLAFARATREEVAVSEIASADKTSRWRIMRDGVVQRSDDGGATWQTQQTTAGVTFVAGASPSRSVCWLVGPAGTVVLQTDGSTWRRIAFPERVDLASVHATDDRRATITTADGRTFETTDGGVTWNRRPGF